MALHERRYNPDLVTAALLRGTHAVRGVELPPAMKLPLRDSGSQ